MILIDTIFAIAILVMSVVIHELAHGYAALYLGDHTAEYEGRLTLNPIKHLDIMGSVVIPLASFLLTGIVFGWAKPVPYNPYNLKNRRWGELIVAAAGPVTNFVLALVAGFFLRFGPHFMVLSPALVTILITIVITNILLAIFNLMPVPPLDGSKILFSLLPLRWRKVQNYIEKYGFFALVFLILFFGNAVSYIVTFIFKLITGMGI